jgi:hypothetical protein
MEIGMCPGGIVNPLDVYAESFATINKRKEYKELKEKLNAVIIAACQSGEFGANLTFKFGCYNSEIKIMRAAIKTVIKEFENVGYTVVCSDDVIPVRSTYAIQGIWDDYTLGIWVGWFNIHDKK